MWNSVIMIPAELLNILMSFRRDKATLKRKCLAYVFNIGFMYKLIHELHLDMAYHSPL